VCDLETSRMGAPYIYIYIYIYDISRLRVKYLLYATYTQAHITHFVKDPNFSKHLRNMRFAHRCWNIEVFWDMTTCRQTVTDESKDESAFIFRVMQTER